MRNKKKKVDLDLSFLKNMPEGRRLYSVVHGNVTLLKNDPKCIQIQASLYTIMNVGFDGKQWGQGECILFPSKDHKTWKNWQQYLMKVGDFIIDNGSYIGYAVEINGNYVKYINCIGETYTSDFTYWNNWANKTQIDKFISELRKNGFEIRDGKLTKFEVAPKPNPASKFKVGEWICNEDASSVAQVIGVDFEVQGDEVPKYTLKYLAHFMKEVNESVYCIDKSYHLWTLKDAKIGDILSQDSGAFIFKGIHSESVILDPIAFGGIGKSGNFWISDGKTRWSHNKVIHPATDSEEQYLIQKMTEAGYRWHPDTLELTPIEKENVKEDIKETESEPKFKIGDWITNGIKTYHIIDLKDGRYICDETADGILPLYVDKHFHLWTVKDARPGDILVTTNDNHPFMFRKLVDDTLPDAICGIDLCGNFKVCEDDGNWWTGRKYYPATEDQKAEFVKKMYDAGYYWDPIHSTLELINTKFNPSTLKPFDKVLCRECSREMWRVSYFSNIVKDNEEDNPLFFTVGGAWYQCIPYNKDTENLLGTCNNPIEFYNIFKE